MYKEWKNNKKLQGERNIIIKYAQKGTKKKLRPEQKSAFLSTKKKSTNNFDSLRTRKHKNNNNNEEEI